MKDVSVLIVDDNIEFLQFLGEQFSKKGNVSQIFSNADEAIEYTRKSEFDVALVDIKMPGKDGIQLLKELKEIQPNSQVIILTGYSNVDTAIEAMKLGSYDYITKPCKVAELRMIVKKAYEKKMLLEQNTNLKQIISRRAGYSKIIGTSDKIEEINKLISKVASTRAPVLIQGESGTGKELVARVIHQQSIWKENPFIIVDCSSLQDTLLENELFGHEKGAFTDAHAEKKGLFEIADGGTLFLDEIGEMSKDIQAKLLRVLDTSEFRRIGGVRLLKADVRLTFATNKDLKAEVKNGNFREDLFYRLSVISINMPSLRERKADIPLLAKYFHENTKIAGNIKKELTDETLEHLMNYEWPGNIRELANVIERSIILSEGEKITPGDLQILVDSSNHVRQNQESFNDSSLEEAVEYAEKNYIEHMLSQYSGNISKLADILKISRASLYRKMKKYNIKSQDGE